MRGVLMMVALAGCQGRGVEQIAVPELSMEITSPTYASFAGDDPIYVDGTVSSPAARVYIEGLQVPVDEQGRFEAWLPVEHAYRNVDIEAILVQQYERVRIPVFGGHDPLETWPGGITMRLTNQGLRALGSGLGAQIDQTGWAQSLLAAVPSIDNTAFSLLPTGISHDPTDVVLEGANDGLALAVLIEDLVLELELRVGGWTSPVTVGFQEVQLGATAVPGIDGAGMITLSLTDSNVTLSEAIVELDGQDNFLLELLGDGLGWIIGSVGQLLGDLVLDGVIGDLPLGGPIAFDTDLMGTPLSIRLADIFGDPDGLALGLGVGIGEAVELGPLSMPYPGGSSADLAVGLHEGLFQFILRSEMLDLLSQDISLGGVLGNIIGVVVLNLPGGNQAPDGDGWCVSVNPGEARVARLQPGIDPLAVIYLPDLRMNIGYMPSGSSTCAPWLDASLAVELGLEVTDGTKLDLSVEVPDGAVLYYGAENQSEGEVVQGLAGLLDTVIGLAGGQFELDLADLLGGADFGFGETQLEIVGSTPLVDAETGERPEGLYTLSMSLWE